MITHVCAKFCANTSNLFKNLHQLSCVNMRKHCSNVAQTFHKHDYTAFTQNRGGDQLPPHRLCVNVFTQCLRNVYVCLRNFTQCLRMETGERKSNGEWFHVSGLRMVCACLRNVCAMFAHCLRMITDARKPRFPLALRTFRRRGVLVGIRVLDIWALQERIIKRISLQSDVCCHRTPLEGPTA